MAPVKTAEEKAFEKVVKDLAKFGITKDAGIEGFPALTGEETFEGLEVMLAAATAAKKEADKLKKEAADEASNSDKTTRSFTLKSGQVRTFSPANHGDEWAEKAAEFAVTHKANIISEA